MANAMYDKALEALLGADVDLASDTIKVALVDTGTYTFSAAHQFYSSVSAGVVGTPVALASKTITNGVFDAADSVFSAVTGSSVEALVLYKDTGVAGTSPLIAYLDTVSSGLPVTPNGGDITITWSNGSSKIFALLNP
jgi:hypothetical protein